MAASPCACLLAVPPLLLFLLIGLLWSNWAISNKAFLLDLIVDDHLLAVSSHSLSLVRNISGILWYDASPVRLGTPPYALINLIASAKPFLKIQSWHVDIYIWIWGDTFRPWQQISIVLEGYKQEGWPAPPAFNNYARGVQSMVGELHMTMICPLGRWPAQNRKCQTFCDAFCGFFW